MNLAPPFSSESLFFLSRLDASAEINGLRIQADRHQPSGSGLCLESRCDDLAIALWVGAEWSGWLAPQLAAPSLAHIEPDLHPAVASWLLSPLNAWLQAASLPELASPTLHQAEAPKRCWRLTFTRADARLSLYMTQIAPALLTRWLAALTPPAEREHTLPLVLGWCWLAAEEAAKIAPGDALPLQGMAPQPDCFWLSSPDSPEQLRLNDAESGVVVRAALPTVALAAADEICLLAEAGRVSLSAQSLGEWAPGLETPLNAYAYPRLQLSLRGAPWAEGTLLRLDDGWAVRITRRIPATPVAREE
ncbi:translocation protein in type III secretion [Edwardsiella piscicida]|uniref:translocation protein in type III secretion n=1 Tax=Edwardsiella piscicida TaxID=1263550 RepID=UPI000D51812E|nr:translocation protein in type III secretion [Edwardsiella piscicida]EKS7794213.1 translocation protein in type III secretion [Edwardsiella piscicida]QBB11582.1 translocation protein in type III secretion [Edwardsiella piscicida]UCQ15495.1 translocation protein in type III secretion [Edwardsiella piscicida]UCQ38690.1 translocation protein in type III secretion [Edwardsiella piscicida]UCQ42014.1 translocation protein in type III secretion [Edwardsiella piscicida]